MAEPQLTSLLRRPVFVFESSQKGPSDIWAIAVLGAMDPRQHQPFWYKLIGCLSEDEIPRLITNTTALALRSDA
jgi:hypothetical protein